MYVCCGVLTAVAMKSSVFWDNNTLWYVESQSTFRRNMSPPLQSRRIKRAKKNSVKAGCKQSHPLTCSFLASSSTPWMEVTCSSETSVDFQRITRYYIQEIRRFLLKNNLILFTSFSGCCLCVTLQSRLRLFSGINFLYYWLEKKLHICHIPSRLRSFSRLENKPRCGYFNVRVPPYQNLN
jgi:hypothetical protein